MREVGSVWCGLVWVWVNCGVCRHVGVVSLGVARCVVLQWDLGVWTVGMGHVACGKEASWCGLGIIWFPYIEIRIFSMSSGPALMLPEVV